MKKKIAAAAAIVAMMQPVAASAKPCIQPAELSDAMIYVMPVAFDAFKSKCAGELSEDGFIAREGDAFRAKYQALHNQTWKGAYGFLKTFMNGESKSENQIADMFDAMPQETAQPFFDAIIKLKLSEEIKVKDCVKIEQVIEPLAPLPAENLGLFISRVVAAMPERREPKICKPDAE